MTLIHQDKLGNDVFQYLAQRYWAACLHLLCIKIGCKGKENIGLKEDDRASELDEI